VKKGTQYLGNGTEGRQAAAGGWLGIGVEGVGPRGSLGTAAVWGARTVDRLLPSNNRTRRIGFRSPLPASVFPEKECQQ